jgi:lysophospholipase L1-like esterase
LSAALFAAKVALGPVLLPQARWLQRTALRLPEPAGERDGVAGEGEPACRILVVGDSSAAGVGVEHQSQALALPLARALNEGLRTAVGWQLAARTGLNAEEARAMLAFTNLQSADVAVVVLGVNDVSSQTSASGFVEQLALLWAELREQAGARWAVFCGLPPMHMLTAVPHPLRWYLGRYADWLDAAVRDWTGRQGLGYCGLRWASDPALLASDGYHPGPRLYPEWAQRLAAILVAERKAWLRPA